LQRIVSSIPWNPDMVVDIAEFSKQVLLTASN